GSPVSLAAGQRVAIQVDYYQHANDSNISLIAKNGGPDYLVPPSWLSSDAGPLPQGWTMAVDQGGRLALSSARLSDRSMSFWDGSGAALSYAWTGSGWTAPPGSDGVLGSDTNGALTLADADGTSYGWNTNGTLGWATAATDAPNAASSAGLTMSWSAANRL